MGVGSMQLSEDSVTCSCGKAPVTGYLVTGNLKGGSNSVVESQPSKLLVAGSIPVSRSIEFEM